MILLTPAQANRIRGLTSPGNALAPIPLANGRYVLPEDVLTDPAHRRYWNILSTFPTVPDDQIRWGRRATQDSPITNSDIEQDPVKLRRAFDSRDWVPGETVTIDP